MAVPASNTPVALSHKTLERCGGFGLYEHWKDRKNLLVSDLFKYVNTNTPKRPHSPIIISIQDLQGPALYRFHKPPTTARTSLRIASWTNMQAIADARWFLFWGRTIFATKEADEDISTTEIAGERRITVCIIKFRTKILYDMVQNFRIGMVFFLDYFLKELE
jgi:hypothetical protein